MPSTDRRWWRSRVFRAIAFVLVLAVALILRLWKLDQPVMWCDEAESSINALTILQHGVPVDHYLGLPIYENTLTDPWPGHPEYEFRDSSYSKKGVAIYHGWLPLYSMAASFKWFGISPDTDASVLKPVHGTNAMSRRTMAARIPAVIFGMVFLVLLYQAGKELYGPDAGWAAMIAAAIAVPMVNISRQARYYSLTAMMSAACCLFGWRMYQRGRWIDFILGGIAFAALFHTHVLTFAIACASVATLVPFMFKHEKAIWKMLVCGLIILGASLPWMIATGFLGAAHTVPKAISTMILPEDLLAWPMKYWQISSVLAAEMALVIAQHLRPRWFGAGLGEAMAPYRVAFYFLGAWIVIGFAMFMFTIPAASLFFQRLYLGAVGPGVLFGAMLFAAIGRSIGRRVGIPIAVVGFVAFAVINTLTMYTWNRSPGAQQRMAWFLSDLPNWKIKPGTRLYSTPNDQLTLTFYTGMPFQSIAPVRKSFLDRYPGDLLLVVCWVPVWPLEEDHVRDNARKFAVPLSDDEVRSWTDKINRVGAARKVADQVKSILPATDTHGFPAFTEPLLEWQLERTAAYRRSLNYQKMNPSVFRGFDYDDQLTMWQVFFYRFVDPMRRIGRNLNYADRMLRGQANVLPTLWIVYTSPGISNSEQAGLGQDNIEEKK